jgi:hypothetical protein
MQVVLEANTWIKSNQSLLFTVVRLLKNPFLNLVRKMMSQSLRVRKGLNMNIAKQKTDFPSALPFPHAMTKQRKVNHNSEIFETFKQVRINIPYLFANVVCILLVFLLRTIASSLEYTKQKKVLERSEEFLLG